MLRIKNLSGSKTVCLAAAETIPKALVARHQRCCSVLFISTMTPGKLMQHRDQQ